MGAVQEPGEFTFSASFPLKSAKPQCGPETDLGNIPATLVAPLQKERVTVRKSVTGFTALLTVMFLERTYL